MKVHVWSGFILLALCVQTVPVGCFTRDGESALRKRVLDGYNGEVRPDPVTKVFMLFHVTSINAVDIRNEIFSVTGFWSMRWIDDRLMWTDYPHIPVMQLNENRVWTPAIVVSNSVDNLSAINEDSIPIRVDRNGTVIWSPPGLVKVSCSMDVTYFPFDRQTCYVEITSFGYTIQEMDVLVYSDGMSFRYYSQSGEWDILNTYSERAEYAEDGYSYARVRFYFEVERKPLYYGMNMLLPVIICSALSIFVFLLPPESGEKIGYCLTVLLAFMVILTLVADGLPTTASSTSILQVYIAVVLLMGGMSVLFSIYVLHLFFKPEEEPVGYYTQQMIRTLMRLTCQEPCCDPPARIDPGMNLNPYSARGVRGSVNDPLKTEAQTSGNKDNSDTRDINAHIRQLTREQTAMAMGRPFSGKRQDQDDLVITWQVAARILDSALLRVYLLFLVVSCIVFVTVLATGQD